MAAKRTAELIPLCHPLALTSVAVDLDLRPGALGGRDHRDLPLKGRTGVEMEALTAASVAALTIYDMCKAIDRGDGRHRSAAAAQIGRQIGRLRGESG